MKKVVRYKCSFCRKEAALPETIERHEEECVKNPEGRNCYVCKHSVKGGCVDQFNGSQWDDNIPFCQLHEEPLPLLRRQGFTAIKCSDFIRDDKMYFERKK